MVYILAGTWKMFSDAHNADCESTPVHNTNGVIYGCDLSGLMLGISFDYNTVQYNITLLPSVNTIALECFMVPSTLMTHSHQS